MMRKILTIVLDAAEPSLIEKWTDDGSMPNLKCLREEGAYGRLNSVAEHLSETVPYTFFSGRNPASHGAQGYATWQAETMKFVPPSPDWLPILPFWRTFSEGGPRAVVLDVSNVYPPTPFNGVEIIGWASHDSLVPFTAYPPERSKWVHEKYSSALLPDEFYGVMNKKDFIEARDLMFRISDGFANLCIDLMQTETWNFFLAYIFTLHHAGHRLWNPGGVSDHLTEEERNNLEGTLRQVYMACDDALGRILKTVESDVTVLVLSMHGMGVNNSRTWILPELLRLVLGEKESRVGFSNNLKQMRELLPLRWRHKIKSSLPFGLRRGLTRFWRSGYNWAHTKAFTLLSDTHGWVRINLKGREAAGIVDQSEYEPLLEQICAGLKTFVDADTGEPIVKAIVRPLHYYSGEKIDRLPDLVIHWADSSSAIHRVVTSAQYGSIPWPTPGRNPEGRGGNHRKDGFLIASGMGVKSGNINGAHILDLAPTILTLLGQPVPLEMEGKVLPIMKQ